jgi:phytoene synthase
VTAAARVALAAGSKSFALAAKLLPRDAAARAAVLYAWCRRTDDAVDDAATPAAAQLAVAVARHELELVYGDAPVDDRELAALREVIAGARIPRAYPDALLDGMARDAGGERYASLDQLLAYCFEVAGTVGLMMSHVLGVRDDRALRRAAHLGIAMQLTNICRDVDEDARRGRRYLPDWLDVRHALALADAFYRSGDAGISALPWRAGIAVRAARSIYARIGRVLARTGFDTSRRAIVSTAMKLALAARAVASQLVRLPLVAFRRRPRIPLATVRFPDDVIPL